MKRASGLLLHISSLYGDYSCGSFGASAREFVDFLCDCGFSYWQTLPFCLSDSHNSPYNSCSAFSVNPNFIDLRELYDDGLITSSELESARQSNPYRCEYTRLAEERVALLTKAGERFGDSVELDNFIKSHPHTENFCRHMAKKATSEQSGADFVTCEPDQRTLAAWRFICYIFCRQWKSIKEYANKKGILIIGDIPIYVSACGADVLEAPENFQLDASGRAAAVAGVPPDYFSPDGQLWGNPLYDWAKMKKDGYRWWRERIAFTREFFDIVRIDHFRGIESYYAIAADASDARGGKWKKGPGMSLVRALREESGEGTLIAEDLGEQTEKLRGFVRASSLPGMRVFQFGFPADSASPHRPHNYTGNSVVYTGTHDNNTLLGYVFGLGEEERRHMLRYCGYNGADWNCCEAYHAIIRTLFASCADTVIIPLQDVLLFGSDTRMNIPGVCDGNWTWRVTREQLAAADRGFFRDCNALYGR